MNYLQFVLWYSSRDALVTGVDPYQVEYKVNFTIGPIVKGSSLLLHIFYFFFIKRFQFPIYSSRVCIIFLVANRVPPVKRS